jgi:hypothetical protein
VPLLKPKVCQQWDVGMGSGLGTSGRSSVSKSVWRANRIAHPLARERAWVHRTFEIRLLVAAALVPPGLVTMTVVKLVVILLS